MQSTDICSEECAKDTSTLSTVCGNYLVKDTSTLSTVCGNYLAKDTSTLSTVCGNYRRPSAARFCLFLGLVLLQISPAPAHRSKHTTLILYYQSIEYQDNKIMRFLLIILTHLKTI